MGATTLVGAGVEPNHTDQGKFHVRYKLEVTDMAGTTNADGDVVQLGQSASDAAGSGETLCMDEDMPSVMSFGVDAETLHGSVLAQQFRYADEPRVRQSAARFRLVPVRVGSARHAGLGERVTSAAAARKSGFRRGAHPAMPYRG